LESLRNSNPIGFQGVHDTNGFQPMASSVDAHRQPDCFFSENAEFFESNQDYGIEESDFEPEIFALSPVDEGQEKGKYWDGKRKFSGSPFLSLDESTKRRKH